MISMNYTDEHGLKSPFYRVSAKIVVRDDQDRILVVKDDTDTFELPGGGWEHDESFEDCVKREIQEELGVTVTHVGDIVCIYRGHSKHPHILLRIAADAELASHDFVLDEDEVTEARFVDKQTFLALPWCQEDKEVVKHVDKLWPGR